MQVNAGRGRGKSVGPVHQPQMILIGGAVAEVGAGERVNSGDSMAFRLANEIMVRARSRKGPVARLSFRTLLARPSPASPLRRDGTRQESPTDHIPVSVT